MDLSADKSLPTFSESIIGKILPLSYKEGMKPFDTSSRSPNRGNSPDSWRKVVLENALDAVVAVNQSNQIIDWNHQSEITFGWKSDEVLGRDMSELIVPPEYRKAHADGMKRLAQTGHGPILNRRIEITALHRNGKIFPVELTVIPIWNEGEQIFYSFVRDISAQKRIFEKERSTQNRLALQYSISSLLANAHNISLMMNQILSEIGNRLDWDVGIFWRVNEKTQRLIGGEAHWSSKLNEFEGFVRESLKRQFELGEGIPGQTWKSGKANWCSDAASEKKFCRYTLAAAFNLHCGLWIPIKSGTKIFGVIEFLKSTFDEPNEDLLLTMDASGSQIGQAIERIQVSEAHKSSVEKYKVFISQSTEGVWRFELDQPISTKLPKDEQVRKIFEYGYLAECNDAMAKMYGFESASQLEGIRLNQILIQEDPKNFDYLLNFISNGYKISEVETNEVDSFGNQKVFVNNLVGYVENDFIYRAWGTQRDVTEKAKVQAEKEQIRLDLEKARAAAEEASRLKSAFLANMSHEIRTPLSSILGFTELLFDPDLTEEDRLVFRETIQRNSDLLTNLIDDILDLSKVESGQLKTERIPVSVRSLLNDLQTIFSLKVAQKKMRFNVEIDPKFPDQIFTDPIRLQQILNNLISNAIKFTEKGFVSLRAYYHAETKEGKNYVSFEVTDSGIGISSEQAKRLFHLFAQADESMTRKYGGTGLGLMLSNRLAQLLGGQVILAKSSPQAGSTFIATIEDAKSIT